MYLITTFFIIIFFENALIYILAASSSTFFIIVITGVQASASSQRSEEGGTKGTASSCEYTRPFKIVPKGWGFLNVCTLARLYAHTCTVCMPWFNFMLGTNWHFPLFYVH